MQSRFTPLRVFVLVLLVAVSASACGKYSIGNLRALMSFKEGNQLYSKGDFVNAAKSYEEAIQHNPEMGIVYFFLANSYDNMYKPGREDDTTNLHKAVENYNKAIQIIKDDEPSGAMVRKRSYEYLIAAYGPTKLNDFSHAEPIAKRLMEMEPNEPGNYQMMGQLYEDQGRYEEAEAHFLKATEIRPNDPLGYIYLAGYYNRQGDNFEKTMAAWEKRAEVEPNNPEAHHTIATWYYDKTFNDFRLPAATKREYIERGLAAEDRALALHADYIEALTFKNILLRMKANMQRDPKVTAELIAEADRLRNRAMELQKTGGGGGQ
jgi:tetratricopeptide (TPR) repeat protein